MVFVWWWLQFSGTYLTNNFYFLLLNVLSPNKSKLFKDSSYLVVLVLQWSVMCGNLLLDPRIPSLSSGFPLVIPPNSLSTMKAVTLSFSTPYDKNIKLLGNDRLDQSTFCLHGPSPQICMRLTSTVTFVLANTVKMSAMPPLEIHILPPLRRNVFPSSDSVALVWMDAASLPL